VLLAYLLFPFDLVPDSVPVLGYADDAINVAGVVRWAGVKAVRRQWPGTDDRFAASCRLAVLKSHEAPRAAEQPSCQAG
jgi:uncharacterized membrane protein YkvA (DUF1232 family)